MTIPSPAPNTSIAAEDAVTEVPWSIRDSNTNPTAMTAVPTTGNM
jgi:hypothetical protein